MISWYFSDLMVSCCLVTSSQTPSIPKSKHKKGLLLHDCMSCMIPSCWYLPLMSRKLSKNFKWSKIVFSFRVFSSILSKNGQGGQIWPNCQKNSQNGHTKKEVQNGQIGLKWSKTVINGKKDQKLQKWSEKVKNCQNGRNSQKWRAWP